MTIFLQQCATGGSGGYFEVKVRHGDSLNSIAADYDTTWQAIARDNGIRRPKEFQVGMVLKVRPGASSRFALEHDSSGGRSGRGGLFFGGSGGGNSMLLWPVNGDVSSPFGRRGRRMHQGIDIRGRAGTAIAASDGGEVVFVGRKSGYGRTIIINHGSIKTLYAHLSEYGVDAGDRVHRGQYIGQVGDSGNAHGPHLHFEVRDRHEVAHDPQNYLRRRGGLLSAR